ncbi:hypothetical protein KFE25_003555 [Diacronema lutheri]|uniref:Letm1 RBD domain-containing protein n=2 Tax=Diacronema lutheri TaxID=2081491 RepID=A0A8J5XMI7_DIALT|nr:hypothetical protein KFE25_003555 [Diacronema lutheri]
MQRSLLLCAFALAVSRGAAPARVSFAPRVPLGCSLRERARAAGHRRARLSRAARDAPIAAAASTSRAVEVAGTALRAIPRSGRVRRLQDLLLLARVKLDLDEAQFALRLAADFDAEPALLADLDFLSIAARLDASLGIVVDELSARILAPDEARSLSDRLRYDAGALRDAARAVSATSGGGGGGVEPPAPPLRLPLSRLDVPLTLEVAYAAPALRLSNASALRAARNASRAPIAGAGVVAAGGEGASLLARLGVFGRELWARLNGRRPDELQQGLEAEAAALARLGRDVSALRAQLGGATTRADALAGVLQRQGLRPLPTAALAPTPAALDALAAALTAATVAVQLDRAYAALEGEILGFLAPSPDAHGAPAAEGAHGGGGAGAGTDVPSSGGAKGAQQQLNTLVVQLAACEAALASAQRALDAPGAGAADAHAGAPAPAGALPDSSASAPAGALPDSSASAPAGALPDSSASAPVARAQLLEGAQRDSIALLARLGLAVLADEQAQQQPPVSTAEPWPALGSALRAALQPLRRGLAFYARGVQIVAQDIRLAAMLVLRAARGHTLTQREVRAVRRTGKDIVMLVPFTVILIMPLSPLGHVLVFGFLQRVWPGFFPSAFTDVRQGMLDMYSALLTAKSRADPAAAGGARTPDGVARGQAAADGAL